MLIFRISSPALLVSQMVKNLPAMRETWVQFPGLGRSPGGGHSNPLQYSCLENPHGQRNLAGYSPWGRKELDMIDWVIKHTAHISFPCGLTGKESACNVGVLGSIPVLGRSPGEEKGYPLQYSGLEFNVSIVSMFHGLYCWARLSDFHFHTLP